MIDAAGRGQATRWRGGCYIFGWCRDVGFVSSPCRSWQRDAKGGVETSVHMTLRVIGVGDNYGTSSPSELDYRNTDQEPLLGPLYTQHNDEVDLSRTLAFH